VRAARDELGNDLPVLTGVERRVVAGRPARAAGLVVVLSFSAPGWYAYTRFALNSVTPWLISCPATSSCGNAEQYVMTAPFQNAFGQIVLK
jgi:hypothetical protein